MHGHGISNGKPVARRVARPPDRRVQTMPVEPSVITSPFLEKAAASLMVAVMAILLYGTVRAITRANGNAAQSRHHFRRAGRYTGLVAIILLLGSIWAPAIRPAATVMGLFAAAIAVAHHKAIMSLTGGIFISWRGLFAVGDRIQVGLHQGDVIGTGPLYFTLFEVGDTASGHQSTGRILKIPNHMIIGLPIVNQSKFFPHVWNELSIVLEPGANWVKARTIFQQLTEKFTKAHEGKARAAISNAKKRAHLILHKTSPRVYITLQHEAPAGIKLTARFLCETGAIRDTEELIYEALLTRYEKEKDIAFAFDRPPGQVPAQNTSSEQA